MSDYELNGYIENKQNYTKEAVESAIMELKNRGKGFSEEETAEILKQFNKKKIDLIEGPINELFPSVKWKLFEMQLNGEINEYAALPYLQFVLTNRISAAVLSWASNFDGRDIFVCYFQQFGAKLFKFERVVLKLILNHVEQAVGPLVFRQLFIFAAMFLNPHGFKRMCDTPHYPRTPFLRTIIA